jgi:hypothetical protein
MIIMKLLFVYIKKVLQKTPFLCKTSSRNDHGNKFSIPLNTFVVNCTDLMEQRR